MTPSQTKIDSLSNLSNCRVVLARPRVAGNLGAVARVMRNLGYSDLVLVAPEADKKDRRARRQSTRGEDILDKARLADDLGEALADCTLVVGTAARTGGLFRRQNLAGPETIMPLLAKALAEGQRAALVFGPEARGLTNAEVTRCHYLLHLPTDPVYPALNLAQAAAICLFELRQTLSRLDPDQLAGGEPPATFAAQEHLFAQLRTALEEIHFLYGPKADSLMHALRHMLGRARLTEMEVEILLGLARQIRWFVKHSDEP